MFLSLKIPYRTVLTTSVAARFIPSLLNDAENISIGFKTRGYQISGGFFEKVKKRAAIIPPLLSNSLERSVQFAEALECRGFGSKGKKTFYSRMKVTRKDLLFIILSTSPLFLLFQSQVIF
jgi:energy-coupling factor transport system permease protein